MVRKYEASLCAVHEIDFLHCRNDAAYRAVFEFVDGSKCRLRLCGNHFAQLWSIAGYLAERKGSEVVTARANEIRETPSRAKRARAGKN